MHIAHVIRDLERSSGGPSRSVPALCRALASQGSSSVRLFYQRGPEPVDVSDGPQMQFVDFGENVRESLTAEHERQPIEFLHAQGLWTWSTHQAIQFARGHGIPYAVSPRGMLSEWCLSYKRWKKKIAYMVYQRADLRNARFLHATSDDEREDICRMMPGAEVQVVPNGCDLPPASLPDPQTPKLAVSICRLHPVKQLDLLIRAWQEINPQDWELVIAGPGEVSYREQLQNEIATGSRIRLEDELDDMSKWQLLGRASLFVLPSHSENFGMSIAEALASGTPVVATDGTPWKVVERVGAGWVCGVGYAEIRQALRDATNTPVDELQNRGSRGKTLVESEFSWSSVAASLLSAYGG